MSIPVNCPHCGFQVGVVVLESKDDFLVPLDERIKEMQNGIYGCNHLCVQKTEISQAFGLVKQTVLYYPETRTRDSWNEYVGPSSKFWLWVAIVFSDSEWITVNGKWAHWKLLKGFYGNGVQELEKLPKLA